jgi:Coenzyme PQQ synthesis protein D (PqqD)
MVEFANRTIAPAHVLVRPLGDEAVLLNLETERYFGLDAMGTRMWELLTASPNIDAAYQKLLEEFEVEPQVLRMNLNDLVGRLVENGLLHLLPDDVGSTPAI